MYNKKVISKTSLTNISKSGKSAFRHIFVNNFFLVHFLKTVSTNLKSASNYALFDTLIEFARKFCLAFIGIFTKLFMQMRTKQLKKGKSFFINMS
jgi:hypothetical protein